MRVREVPVWCCPEQKANEANSAGWGIISEEGNAAQLLWPHPGSVLKDGVKPRGVCLTLSFRRI